jgi:hypothetical protein
MPAGPAASLPALLTTQATPAPASSPPAVITIPESLHITGAVAEWESWTGMEFPETGDYVFPAGLATVRIDRERDSGEYWEPNIWIIHEARGGTQG